MALIKTTDALLQRVHQLLRQRRGVQAHTLTQDMLSRDRKNVDIWIADSRAKYVCGDYISARNSVASAINLAPNNWNAKLLDIEILIQMGEVRAAITGLNRLVKLVSADGVWLAKAAEMYSQCGAFAAAAKAAQAASKLKPNSTAIRYNLAASLTVIGNLEQAEQEFDSCIHNAPHDYDAYYNRANLRKQTPSNNHVEEIRAVLAAPLKHPMATVQLNYALAKELEDLGRYADSFAALKLGAGARRKMLSYDVTSDIQAMEMIATTFDTEFFARDHPACTDKKPIFILGFPRSGTTLIDRILSSHPEVESLGELTDFAMALTGLCEMQMDKSGLIQASKSIDMRTLGQEYLRRARQRSQGCKFFIDKTPANYLYIGLIAAALPQAKIIHVNRSLADCGFGMYKTLFRMGYPYSYDLEDLGRYMKAKETLMAHWRVVLPGHILDIDYEDIVSDQEGETRKLLKALGLDWDATCLDFHKNQSPSATASAAQVRKPIYSNAVGRWKRYDSQLAPFIQALGISK